jgi:transcriptional regulator GlxA family with amidase domain
MNIGIYSYDGVEVLDFTGPFEVFTTAARVSARLSPGAEPTFHVFLVAEDRGMVKARGGLHVQPDYTIQQHPEIEVLIVPGGVHEPELDKPQVIKWIAIISKTTGLTASVCTGAFLLAGADLLQDRPCTTHWEDITDLRAKFPNLDVREGVPWVESGKVITSAGISAGIEMALHLVTRLAGKDLALRTAHQMLYRWNSAHLSKENL